MDIGYAIIWSCVSVFDLAVMVLTARKGWNTYSHSLSHLWFVFMRDGVPLYCLQILVTNLLNALRLCVLYVRLRVRLLRPRVLPLTWL